MAEAQDSAPGLGWVSLCRPSEWRLKGTLSYYLLDCTCSAGRGHAHDSRFFSPCILRCISGLPLCIVFVEIAVSSLVSVNKMRLYTDRSFRGYGCQT